MASQAATPQIARWSGFDPSTDHFQMPTMEMMDDPLFQAIWNEINPWMVSRAGDPVQLADGRHVAAIYLAIRDRPEIAEMYKAVRL